jgi:cysteine synthase
MLLKTLKKRVRVAHITFNAGLIKPGGTIVEGTAGIPVSD